MSTVDEPQDRDALEQDQRDIESLLLEGLDSGEPIEVTPEFWERKRKEFALRHRFRP